MQISFCNGNDKNYQARLNQLLKPIFLDFQFWYDLNLWDSNYESYSITEDNEIISNICLFKTKVQFRGNIYDALSVGAVATKNAYRGKGYSRILMEHILNKYPDTPMYLSANDDVVDFYPKFGFKRVYEKLPVLDVKIENQTMPVKRSYNDPKVWNYVMNRCNFSKHLDCLNTSSINLFHIYLGYLKDCLYEIPELHALIVAENEETTLKLMAVFTENSFSFSDLKRLLPFNGIERIEFGFSPDNLCDNYGFEEYKTDPLFVRNVKCDLGDFKFPELSMT